MNSLKGIKVVALEQAVSLPLATRHMADLGAEVIKIERPQGDFARGYDSHVHGLSTYFVWLNAGKRSISLNLKSDGARDVALSLIERADVFVQNLGPGVAERLDLGPDQMTASNPRLVYCGLTGYGSAGPYRDRKGYDPAAARRVGGCQRFGYLKRGGQGGDIHRGYLWWDVCLGISVGCFG